jgi:hypothetical protein
VTSPDFAHNSQHTVRPTRGTCEIGPPSGAATREMEHIVNTVHNRKKLITSALGSAVAGAAVPAVLFLGSGTAAAQPQVNPYPKIGLGNVTVQVADVNGQSSWCTFHATQLGGLGIYDSLPFFLGQNAQADVVIWPALPTGYTWDTWVNCEYPGGNSANTQVQF